MKFHKRSQEAGNKAVKSKQYAEPKIGIDIGIGIEKKGGVRRYGGQRKSDSVVSIQVLATAV